VPNPFPGFNVPESAHHVHSGWNLAPLCPTCLRKLVLIDCSREVIICESGHEFDTEEAFELYIPELGASRN